MNRSNDRNWVSNLYLYLTSQGLTLLGSSIVSFSLIWYVTLTTKSGIAVTLITVTTFLPQALIMLYAGVLADRYSPKRIILISDLSIATATLMLAILTLYNKSNLEWVLFFNVIRSLGSGVQLPATKSVLPLIVPEEKLLKANSYYTSIWCIIQLISPGISGIVLSAFTLTGALFVDVGTAVIGCVLLKSVKIAKNVDQLPQILENPFESFKIGYRYIRGNLLLKKSLLFYTFFSFLVVPASQLSPLLATHLIGDEVWIFSVIETAFSIGALIMSLLLANMNTNIKRHLLIGVSAIIFGITMMLLVLSKHVIIFGGLMLIMGLGSPLYYTPLMTHIQSVTDEIYMGRTFSFVDLFASLAMPVGMLIFGLISTFNICIPFIGAGALLVLLGLQSDKIAIRDSEGNIRHKEEQSY